MSRIRVVSTVLLVAGCFAGCGGHHRSSARVQGSGVAPRLVGVHRCAGIAGFTCGWLSVPLDHAGWTRGTLRLAVGVQQVARPSHGVLLFLTGGPGQPGVSLIPRVVSRLGSALEGYRLVMFD